MFLLQNDADVPPPTMFTYKTHSPAILNHTFEQVPCFRQCEVLVKKLSSDVNSNSTITECERTPKLSK